MLWNPQRLSSWIHVHISVSNVLASNFLAFESKPITATTYNVYISTHLVTNQCWCLDSKFSADVVWAELLAVLGHPSRAGWVNRFAICHLGWDFAIWQQWLLPKTPGTRFLLGKIDGPAWFRPELELHKNKENCWSESLKLFFWVPVPLDPCWQRWAALEPMKENCFM